jgi:hypothetical protein
LRVMEVFSCTGIGQGAQCRIPLASRDYSRE